MRKKSGGNGMTSLVIEDAVRARGVRVDNGWVCVELEDDREIRFPISKSRRLSRASLVALRNVELICGGTGLHWPDLDEDLSVRGILEGRFG
jgi:hypothetical protein